jgi:hypothetical protein
MFETDFEEWQYATHGGTMFIVNYAGRLFGVTCAHVRRDFPWRQLAITDVKFGRGIAGLKGVYCPSQPFGDAEGSDVLDLAVIEFADDVGPDFFRDGAYILDKGTIGSSKSGDKLLVNGALKAESKILDEIIAPVFGLLEFEDGGPGPHDLVTRLATGRFTNPEFEGLTGLSGSPVFNVTNSCLAGVMVRGSLKDGTATMRYIDVAHLEALLAAIVEGNLTTAYKVSVPA